MPFCLHARVHACSPAPPHSLPMPSLFSVPIFAYAALSACNTLAPASQTLSDSAQLSPPWSLPCVTPLKDPSCALVVTLLLRHLVHLHQGTCCCLKSCMFAHLFWVLSPWNGNPMNAGTLPDLFTVPLKSLDECLTHSRLSSDVC